jgi:hypothetical protein
MPTFNYVSAIKHRLDAAQDRIDEFKAKSSRLFLCRPHAILCEEKQNGEIKLLRYRFMVHREIPAGLRIPNVGSLLQHRAIVDNLVWALSKKIGERPSYGIKFPVCLTEYPSTPNVRAFETSIRDNKTILTRFPIGPIDLIRQLPPFNPYNGDKVGVTHPVYIRTSS